MDESKPSEVNAFAKRRALRVRGLEPDNASLGTKLRMLLGLAVILGVAGFYTVAAFQDSHASAYADHVPYQQKSQICSLDSGVVRYEAEDFEIVDDHYTSYEVTLHATVMTVSIASTTLTIDSTEPRHLQMEVPFDHDVEGACEITVRGISP